MQMQANLLYPGNMFYVGKTQCQVLKVRHEGILINIQYQTAKKQEIKNKSFKYTQLVKVV